MGNISFVEHILYPSKLSAMNNSSVQNFFAIHNSNNYWNFHFFNNLDDGDSALQYLLSLIYLTSPLIRKQQLIIMTCYFLLQMLFSILFK